MGPRPLFCVCRLLQQKMILKEREKNTNVSGFGEKYVQETL